MYRTVCFTWNIDESKADAKALDAAITLPRPDSKQKWKIKYCIAQLERAPTTGQLHWQGYLS